MPLSLLFCCCQVWTRRNGCKWLGRLLCKVCGRTTTAPASRRPPILPTQLIASNPTATLWSFLHR
jgi:hypothetical protein